jgi:hypothetical protein
LLLDVSLHCDPSRGRNHKTRYFYAEISDRSITEAIKTHPYAICQIGRIPQGFIKQSRELEGKREGRFFLIDFLN